MGTFTGNKQKKREYIEFYRATHPCYVCGETDPVVLQFHHVDPDQKSFVIGRAIHSYGMNRLKEEIAKCVILCANCHRRVHAGTIDLEDYRT